MQQINKDILICGGTGGGRVKGLNSVIGVRAKSAKNHYASSTRTSSILASKRFLYPHELVQKEEREAAVGEGVFLFFVDRRKRTTTDIMRATVQLGVLRTGRREKGNTNAHR